LDTQIQEIKESVELPLTHPEYYEEMGIKPPKGVILYGPPGTGKTLLAKAVANQTSATFLRVVGSELIQKYLVSTCSTLRVVPVSEVYFKYMTFWKLALILSPGDCYYTHSFLILFILRLVVMVRIKPY
jgi:hypothetical protein